MKKLFILLSAIVWLTSLSFALAEDTDETRLAIAEKLVAETVTSSFVKNMTNSLWPPIETSLRKKNPNINDEALEGLKNDLADQQKSLVADLIVDMPAIYARYFTTQDLETIYEFQTSKVGKKALQLQPQIMAEIMPKILKSVQEQTPILMKNFKKRAKEKGFKL